MNLRRLGPRVALLAAIALIGVGAAQLVLAQTSPPDRSLPVADPYAGLTDAEKQAAHEANTAGYQQRYADWLERFVALDIDPGTLERLTFHGRSVEPRATLAEAVGDADLIVHGAAENIAFEFHHMYPLASVVFRVESSLRGDAAPGETIVVRFAGGPHPTSGDFRPDEAFLIYDEAAPLLLPGMEALLFLQRAEGVPFKPGEYTPQNFTGVYLLEDGRTTALDGNPFGGAIASQAPAAFPALIDAAR